MLIHHFQTDNKNAPPLTPLILHNRIALIIFNLCWNDCSTQEKLKTMDM